MPLTQLLRSAGLGDDKSTARAALQELIAGNRRFLQGEQLGCTNDAVRRHKLRLGQAPRAVVLTCADSRCPPELIFDQGFGDLFVIRVAGNIVSEHVLGSVSYALQHLGTRLVLVLGHSSCGAVKAALAEFVVQAKQRQAEQASTSSEGGSDVQPSSSDADGPPGSAEQAGNNARRRWRVLSMVPRLLKALGGQEATETLVRTASFRDPGNRENPVNAIVAAIQPAVKQIVWEVLHEGDHDAPTGLTPGASGSASPRVLAPALADVPSLAEAARRAAAAVVVTPDEAEGEVDSSGEDEEAEAIGASGRSGSEGDGRPRGLPPSKSMAHLVQKLAQPLLVRPSVCSQALEAKLADAEHICLDTHLLNSSNLLCEVAYQNVRRQCSAVWDAMQRYVEAPAAAELLMVQAMYDLETGAVDFFGLHG